jgi:hypothetical protein
MPCIATSPLSVPAPGPFSGSLSCPGSTWEPGRGLTKETLAQYDRIIICGPIWMGTLVAPLRGLLQQLKNSHQEICHITCCGSKDEKKDDTFGYGTVFPKVKKIVGERLILSEAFPIVLVLPENQREDDELIMNTRLSDENFHGRSRIGWTGLSTNSDKWTNQQWYNQRLVFTII